MAPRTDRMKDESRFAHGDADVIPLSRSRTAQRVEAGAADDGLMPWADQPRWSTVLGTVLRDERRRQGRTLADVADRAAVSLPYLSEVERGRKEISSDLLAAVMTSLDVDLASVLDRAARSVRSGGVGSARLLAA